MVEHELPKIEARLGAAEVVTEGSELSVSTGRMQRVWQLTGQGLMTTRVADLDKGLSWESDTSGLGADWVLPLWDVDRPHGWLSDAELRSLSVRESDDEGFTAEHLEVAAEFAYPDERLQLRLLIWVWPDAPGVRTQLFARTLPGFESPPILAVSWHTIGTLRCDAIPVSFVPGARRRMIGYFSDTQNRNDTHQDLLQERVSTDPIGAGTICWWANILQTSVNGDWARKLNAPTTRSIGGD